MLKQNSMQMPYRNALLGCILAGASALPLSASLDISKTGINEASVNIRDEILTVSSVMQEVTYYQHYNGVAKLYL